MSSLMKLAKLQLTDEEVAELNAPYSRKEAYDATMLGMARAFSEAGCTPGQIEEMLKIAGDSLFGNTGVLEGGIEAVKDYGLLGIGVGALGGAYLGHLHNQIDQAVTNKDDPKVVELKRKIDSYRNMSADLKRTNAVTA